MAHPIRFCMTDIVFAYYPTDTALSPTTLSHNFSYISLFFLIFFFFLIFLKQNSFPVLLLPLLRHYRSVPPRCFAHSLRHSWQSSQAKRRRYALWNGHHGELDWTRQSDSESLYGPRRLWRWFCFAYSLGSSSFCCCRWWPGLFLLLCLFYILYNVRTRVFYKPPFV